MRTRRGGAKKRHCFLFTDNIHLWIRNVLSMAFSSPPLRDNGLRRPKHSFPSPDDTYKIYDEYGTAILIKIKLGGKFLSPSPPQPSLINAVKRRHKNVNTFAKGICREGGGGVDLAEEQPSRFFSPHVVENVPKEFTYFFYQTEFFSTSRIKYYFW